MRVIVDTTVWSLAVRRRRGALSSVERAIVFHWTDLVRDNRAVLIGPVRQEILSGVRDAVQFERLRDHLRGFEDEPLSSDDFEQAAAFANACLNAGVAFSPADLIVCAAAAGRDLPVFTTDPDFRRYTRHLPVRLHQTPNRT